MEVAQGCGWCRKDKETRRCDGTGRHYGIALTAALIAGASTQLGIWAWGSWWAEDAIIYAKIQPYSSHVYIYHAILPPRPSASPPPSPHKPSLLIAKRHSITRTL